MPPDTPEEAYNELAPTYAADLENNPYNQYLDFPGTTSLIPPVEDKRILDAGCGTGQYTVWLYDQGAEVVGVDVSDGMLDEARDRLPNAVTLHQADLAEPLEFAADNAFDGIVSGLALSYLPELTPTFEEFHRILEPGGFLVASMSHPFDEFPLEDDENYFHTEPRIKDWDVEIPYYRRPISAIINPLLDAGFALEQLAEPQPTAEFKDVWPERYEKESRYPVFLAVHATA